MWSRAKERKKERYEGNRKKRYRIWEHEEGDGAKHTAKSIVRNFLPCVPSTTATGLFILPTVHLTLKCADDFPLFPAHFALALLLRAFSLSRLFGNLFFFRRVAMLFVTVNHRYLSPSTFFLVMHNRILILVLILVRLLFSEKNIYKRGKKKRRRRKLTKILII